MSYSIEKIEGIGPNYAKKLKVVDIQTVDDLLRLCGDKKGRDGVATETGISEKHLLEWTNLADLMRINGIGEEYADLLEEAGVDTVKELATRKAENLATAMATVNEKKKLTNRVPSAKTVEEWVKEAKKLKPMVSH